MGIRAFDNHRSKGKCLPLVDGKDDYWQNENGRWHQGPKMGTEVKFIFKAGS
jgi:hypothetical protein